MVAFLGRLLASLFICLFLISSTIMANEADQEDPTWKKQPMNLSLGAIVDYTSLIGKGEKVAMEMGVVDFCAPYHHGVVLHTMDSRRDPLRAASSARKLINKHQVRVILGLDRWEETLFAAEIGNKSQVPILSLADVPLWASRQWPFLVNMARSQYAQMKAVAAIVQSWQWRKVTVIYEDTTAMANSIFPYLITALHEVNSDTDVLIPLPPLPPYDLSKNLENLKRRQGRVFIVHTCIELATNLFMEAKKMGMMENEYVWITTESITSQVDSLNASVISSMQGVLGVKSYFSHTKKQYKEFSSRFQAMFHLQYPNDPYMEPGTFALQAYDAVWAVALAMQGKTNQGNLTNRNASMASLYGWDLLDEILQSNFKGLTGDMSFRGGALAPAHIFRIINVVGKSYRELGYWSDGLGFSVSIKKGSSYSQLMKILGQVYWPGGPWFVPRGWVAPTSADPLKIGVPSTTTFSEFVNVAYDHPGGGPVVAGFAIDVFRATVDRLPYDLNYIFIPYNGTYDSMVQQIHLKIFDAVVGDTAIVANRCEYAEFSQPYTDSGLQMVMYAKPRKTKREWLFLKPFTTGMWISIIVVNIYNGFVVWVIEREKNQDFQDNNRFGTTIWLAFTTVFTSLQGDKLHTNVSRMAVVVWLFVALVISSSYTASLTSFLTLQNFNPKVVDVETLKKSGAQVGCDGNSFVGKYLETVLGLHPNNIKKLYSGDDYPQALISGEITAAFLEVPYVKVLLAKYCNNFTTGATYKVGGFGFVFPRGAPILPDISTAVLSVSENGTLRELENSLVSSYKCSSYESDNDHDNLGFQSFYVLFLITVLASAIALLIFKCQETTQARARAHAGNEAEQQNGAQDPLNNAARDGPEHVQGSALNEAEQQNGQQGR